MRFNFEDQDFFNTDPVRYAAALGEEGLAEYREEIARRPVREHDFARIVALLGGDLSGPYQFVKLAEALREIGLDDDALAWSRRGIAETNGWQVAKLYDLAAELLADRSDNAAVLDLRRDQHHRMPGARRTACCAAPRTSSMRAR